MSAAPSADVVMAECDVVMFVSRGSPPLGFSILAFAPLDLISTHLFGHPSIPLEIGPVVDVMVYVENGFSRPLGAYIFGFPGPFFPLFLNFAFFIGTFG